MPAMIEDNIQVPEGYRVQEDLRCCANCAQHDSYFDAERSEILQCTVYGDPVKHTGICNDFEF